MAAASVPAPVTSSAPVVDRQQRWVDVQAGVASLLTEAARPVEATRRAG